MTRGAERAPKKAAKKKSVPPKSGDTIASLRERLETAEQTLEAIRSGSVDALVVAGPNGERVFTLQGADHRYRRIVESMTEGATIVGTDGTIYYANRSFSKLVGVPLDRVLGSTIGTYVHNGSHEAIDQLVGAARKRTTGSDIHIATSDGTILVHVSATTEDIADGGVCLIFTDLSESLRELLEGEKAARAEAESASRLKDEFLATLSHELRTPLNSILGWGHMLVEGSLPEEKRAHALATILRNATAQHRLIEDLLDVSRIVNGNLRLSVESVDLATVIDAAVEAVRPAADAKDVKVVVDVKPGVGNVRGDASRLQQVVWNLATNAVKFTPRGGTVTLSLAAGKDSVEIRVVDTGAGIAPEFLPYVFDRFRQEDGGITRRNGGLGLGLSIARQLVELHGGSITVKSDGLGKGAAFVVELPFAPQKAIAPAPRPATRSTNGHGTRGGSKELEGVSVLVVDDERDARELLQSAFEQHGAIVTTAASAAEGLAAIASERPTVIVSDIGMPGEDGYAFIRKVRALSPENGGRTPALALTAYARAEDRVRALREGFQTHAAKPVEPVELLTLVASLARRVI